MKICPKCNATLVDEATYCPSCGSYVPIVTRQAPTNNTQPQYYTPQPQPDKYDHTEDFDAQDISDNKVYAMLVYLLGVFGVVIAAISAKDSAYVQFHMRQGMKLMVVTTLALIAGSILCVILIGLVLLPLALGFMEVLSVIAFIQVCQGKAKEPFLVRDIPFLK